MDRKYYIPYETAKQIKEKGFPQEHEWFYCDDGKGITPSWDGSHCDCSDGIACPTYHEVIDWLEGRKVRIYAEYCNGWYGFIDNGKAREVETTTMYPTREEALNDGILKALEML